MLTPNAQKNPGFPGNFFYVFLYSFVNFSLSGKLSIFIKHHFIRVPGSAFKMHMTAGWNSFRWEWCLGRLVRLPCDFFLRTCSFPSGLYFFSKSSAFLQTPPSSATHTTDFLSAFVSPSDHLALAPWPAFEWQTQGNCFCWILTLCPSLSELHNLIWAVFLGSWNTLSLLWVPTASSLLSWHLMSWSNTPFLSLHFVHLRISTALSVLLYCKKLKSTMLSRHYHSVVMCNQERQVILL